jgi:LPS-assembly protein
VSALSRIIGHQLDGDSLPRTLLPLALLLTSTAFDSARAAWDCRPAADGRNWNCTGGTLRDDSASQAAPATPAAAPATSAVVMPAPTDATSDPASAAPAAGPSPRSTPVETGDAPEQAAAASGPGRAAVLPPEPAILTSADEMAAATSAGAITVVGDIDAGIDWDNCAIPAAALTGAGDVPSREEAARLPVIVDADSMVAASANEVVEFAGNVNVTHGDLSLRADQLKLNRMTREVDASGGVTAIRPDLRIGGSAAQYQLDSRTGRLEGVEYRVPAIRARGTAQTAELLAGGKSRYEDISYTTCRPGNSDWLLTASSLELDHDAGIGTADKAKLSFLGVPILYVPTMTYPIDDRRRSGFLLPSVGYSDSNGFDLSVPYYFNLAENYDFTFAPRILTKRGLLLGGELRYLTETSQGELAVELLPNDSEFDGSEQIRGAISLLHHTQFSDRSSGNVRFGQVSDREYLSDLGNNLAATSKTHIEQTGELRYRAETWSLLGRVQQHQTIDEAIARNDRPYARLPQVRLDLYDDRGLGGTAYHLQAEYVNFHRDNDSVRGHRMDLFPAISLPLRNSWGFLIPKAGARYTAYDLTDQAAGQDSSPSTASAMFSLDSGLLFERTADYFGSSSVHTLEPRIYYLHVPSNDQSDQPIFDTAEQDFSFDRLFRENRFSGADRFGDANQLTLALTSRYLSLHSGEELLRASVGQIVYFDDREVTLPGQPTETESSSPVVAELSGRIGPGWRATAGIEWDPHAGGDGNIDQALAQVSYRGPEGRAFNASYRMRDNEIEQTDIAGVWPVNDTLSVIGRYNHSLRDDRLLEAVAGFEYRSCCWRFRSLLHSYANGTDDDQNVGVLFQLELNGLGRLGDNIESVLERSIYAYR